MEHLTIEEVRALQWMIGCVAPFFIFALIALVTEKLGF